MLGPSVGHKCWGGEIRERVIVLLNEKAVELAVKTESVEVMPNHVHLFVRTSLVPARYFLSGQMKGYTVRNLRAAFFPLAGVTTAVVVDVWQLHRIGRASLQRCD